MPTTKSGGNSRRFQLGKYEVKKHIASGGMGAVYKAVNTETGQEVALKVLPPEYAARPHVLERFRREFRNGVKLRHENIAALFEFAEEADTFFLVMEFVDGHNLYEYIRHKNRLDPEEARGILIQVAKGLEHAHQLNIIHRDIKPSNILLPVINGRTVAKIIDMGLARETNEDEFRLTRDGTTVGTVDYLAPEQARDSRAADHRSDIYSLGCTLFHMLAGVPPFAEGTMTERIFKHADAEPPDLRQFNRAIPRDLLTICRRMMAKKPADRYQSSTELLRDLVGFEEDKKPEETEVAPPEKTPPVRTVAVRPEPVPPPAEPVVVRETTLNLSPSNAAPTTILAEDPTPSSFEHRQVAHGQFQRASQVLADGNFDYAVRLLLACCNLDPTNLLYRQALRQARRGGKPIKQRWGDWFRMFGLLFRFYRAKKRGNPVQVLRLGEEILSRQPGNVAVQLDMASAASSAGYINLAIWLLEQAKMTDGLHLRVNRALANLIEKQSDFSRAITLWEEVVKADPGNFEAQQKLKELAARETIARGHYLERSDKASMERPVK